MLKITKQEAFQMRKILGEEYVKKSYSKHPSYYLVELPFTLAALDTYRNGKITN